MRGVFKVYDEPESPDEGACLRCMLIRNGHTRGVLKMYDESESSNEGAYLGYVMNLPRTCIMMNRNRQMRGRV